MANVCRAQGNQIEVVAKLHNGLHNPMGTNLMVLPIKDGQGFSLK
jgi:hypothetical protein